MGYGQRSLPAKPDRTLTFNVPRLKLLPRFLENQGDSVTRMTSSLLKGNFRTKGSLGGPGHVHHRLEWTALAQQDVKWADMAVSRQTSILTGGQSFGSSCPQAI